MGALGAASRDRHVVLAAVDLAEFAGNTLVADADRPGFSAFVREVFGPRARALGFAPRAGESDDDQLAAPRAAALRRAGGSGARRAGAPARAGVDRRPEGGRRRSRRRRPRDGGPHRRRRDVRRAARRSEGDAGPARSPLPDDGAVLVHRPRARAERAGAPAGPVFDVRESWTALHNVYWWNPARRATSDFIMANFDALAKTVARDAPGGWPKYAAGLCSDRDRTTVAAFWKDAGHMTYEGAPRELANALESIDLCTRLQSAAKACRQQRLAARRTAAADRSGAGRHRLVVGAGLGLLLGAHVDRRSSITRASPGGRSCGRTTPDWCLHRIA